MPHLRQQPAAPATPATRLPSWLELHAEHRTRAESITNRYRAGEVGGDEMVLFRTRAQVRVTTRHLLGIAEVQDSRVGFTDSASTVTNRLVFDTKLSQLSLGLRWPVAGRAGLRAQIEVGRFSREYGMGRLVSRLIYANISNIQDGVVAGVRGGQWTVQALALRPAIYTYPEIARDTRYRGARFGGVYATTTRAGAASADVYFFRLDDGDRFPAGGRRRLNTPGVRLFGVVGSGGHVDYEFETAVQWGRVGPLAHQAWFEHLQAGYGWPRLRWAPRVTGIVDYASGDADPTDARSGAFDTLYGRTRFEFGPSGMFGVIGRSNMVSPGAQLVVRPTRSSDVTVQHRWARLAQARDRWRSVGIGDPTGAAGTDVGTQLEVRLRYRWSRFLELDGGFAHFREGAFVRAVRPSPAGSTTIYLLSAEWRY